VVLPTEERHPATPKDYSGEKLAFPLQDDEHVLHIARRHWMHLWLRTLLWSILALAPVVVLPWLLFSVMSVSGTAAQVFWGIAALWLLFWIVKIALNWYQYRHDVWVVTNQRIVDVMRPTPLGLKVSSADLVNIQDMTVERRGILQTGLNFGDIHCDTAGQTRDFLLSGVPNPTDLQLLIDRERDRERLRSRGA
jgi:hypothetical protein